MNKFFSFLIGSFVAIAVLTSFDIKSNTTVADGKFEIPENINAIFKKSCFGCHNTDSKNEDGKEELMIDKLSKLKKSKLASKLNKIAKTTAEGEMPPEKFLKKYPDKALTDEEAKTLIEWAKASAEAL